MLEKCVDNLIEMQGEIMSEFIKGVLCLVLAVILFLLAGYLEINSFKELF